MPIATGDPSLIASTVERIRVERGMTKRELALKARLGRNTIGRVESGKPASDTTYGRIAIALDVPLTQLFEQGD